MSVELNSSVANANNIQQNKKTRNVGFARGYLASSVPGLASTAASAGVIYLMRKASEMSQNDSIELTKAAQKALETTGLAQKGVQIHEVAESLPVGKTFVEKITNWYANALPFSQPDPKDAGAIDAFKEELKGCSRIRRATKGMDSLKKDAFLESAASSGLLNIKLGTNACYLPKANKVVIPDTHLKTSVFHEIGHAMNNNGGKFMKALQKCRPLMMYAPVVILLVSLLNKRTVEDIKENPDAKRNPIQKVADGIKSHAGLLTGLCVAPTLAEEGIASLRGTGVAKGLCKIGELSKKMLNKVKLTNLCGFTSYALGAAGIIAGIRYAIKVKDNIQKKHNEKQALKQNQQVQK